MRDAYTPLFQDTLTSSIWTFDSDTRIVWFTFLMLAQHDGFVPGSVPGIANIAQVPEQAARDAIARFEAPDPDSRSTEFEGRRIVKTARGWHILNYVAARERAKTAAERARKAAWQKKNYHAQQEPDPRQLPLPGFDESKHSDSLDAHKQKLKPKPKEGEEGTPPPPARGDFVESRHLVLDKLPDDWELSDELRAAAVIAGVPPGDIDARVNDLRLGPIGGTRGVFAHKVDAYIKQQFGKWKTWAEVDRAKALSRAATGAPKRFGGGEPPLEPTGAERAHAAKFGYDIDEVFRALNEQDCVTRLGREGARDEAKRRMKAAAKAAKERAA